MVVGTRTDLDSSGHLLGGAPDRGRRSFCSKVSEWRLMKRNIPTHTLLSGEVVEVPAQPFTWCPHEERQAFKVKDSHGGEHRHIVCVLCGQQVDPIPLPEKKGYSFNEKVLKYPASFKNEYADGFQSMLLVMSMRWMDDEGRILPGAMYSIIVTEAPIDEEEAKVRLLEQYKSEFLVPIKNFKVYDGSYPYADYLVTNYMEVFERAELDANLLKKMGVSS